MKKAKALTPNIDDMTFKQVMDLLGDDFREYSKTEYSRTSFQFIAFLDKYENELSKALEVIKSLEKNFKNDCSKFKTSHQLATVELISEDIGDSKKSLEEANKTIDRNIKSGTIFATEISNNSVTKTALDTAKNRHKAEDAIATKLLYNISKKLGGPLQVYKLFEKWPSLIPPTLPKFIDTNAIKSRIKRYKDSLS